jgi:hypothetical protein
VVSGFKANSHDICNINMAITVSSGLFDEKLSLERRDNGKKMPEDLLKCLILKGNISLG